MLKKPLILIGDDNRFIIKILQDLLIDENYDIIFAKNGEQTLEMFIKYSPDIILLDVMMPLKSGLEVCHEIRKNIKDIHTPIIMITTLSNNSDIKSIFDSGADDYIKKPINEIVLKSRIKRMLETERYRKQLEINARYDSLTNVFNRTYFVEKFISEINKLDNMSKNKIGIIFADLDQFKELNDKYGHNFGDEVLKKFSTILKEKCRKNDFVARYGGDEFIFCSPNSSFNDIYDIANSIKLEINELQESKWKKFSVSFGINVISYEDILLEIKDNHDIINGIVELTDKQLYMAKKCGRDKVCFL